MGRFTESFDSYAPGSATSSTIGIFSRWLTDNAGSYSLVAGRFGGQALQVGSGLDANRRIWAPLGFTTSRFRLSIAARFTSAAGRPGVHIGVGQGSGVQVAIKFAADTGKFSLVRGGTHTADGVTLWESEKTYANSVFRTLRLTGFIDPAVGELSFMIDDEEPVVLTGLNTRALATPDITDMILLSRANSGSSGGTNGTYDDVVVEDTDASHLPECRIQQLRPNSDGATLNLVPSSGVDHYAMVDEATVSLADYLSGSVVGDLDRLGVEDMTLNPATILGVKALGFAAKTDAASRAWRLGLESGGTVVEGADLSLTSDPQYYEHEFAQDPDTSAEWTVGGVNALQLQAKVAV